MLFAAFAGMGATASLVPAILPTLAKSLSVPTWELRAVAPALFAGLLVGVLLAPLLVRRSASSAVRGGTLIQALALAGLIVASSPAAVIAVAAMAGLGFGIVEASGTVLARQLAGAAVTRLLTLLTAAVAIVAAVGPLLIVALGTLRLEFAVLGVAAALHLGTGLLLRSAPRREAAIVERAPIDGTVIPIAVARAAIVERAPIDGTVIPIAVALFCYVGVESILAGWSAATVERELATTAANAAVGTSAFWLLMTIGRLIGSRLLQTHWSPRALVGACVALITALLIGSVLVLPVSVAAGLALLALAAICCGPCYALFVGMAASAVAPGRATAVVASLIAVGALGGTLIPLVAALGAAGRDSLWIAAAFAVVALAAVAVSRTRT